VTLGFLIWVFGIGFISGNTECSTKSPPWEGELFVWGQTVQHSPQPALSKR